GIEFRAGMETWTESLLAATRLLEEHSGCARLVIVAEGVGAAVAGLAADRLANLEGIAFLAPVVSGRAHVRELSVFSRLIEDKLGMKKRDTAAALEIAGLVLPQEIEAGLRGVDLMKTDKAPARNVAVFTRDNHPEDAAFAAY